MKPFVLVTDPPGVISNTSTAPAACAGVTIVTEVALTLVSKVPAVPSNLNAVVLRRFVPVIVTAVPPAVGPPAGEMPVIVGTPTKVKPFVLVAEPPRVVNTTFTAPAAFAGVTTVTDVALTFVSDVPAVPPNVTLLVPERFVPVMVSVVPPATGPLDWDSSVIVGAAIYRYPFVAVAEPPAVVNTTSTAPAVLAGVSTVIEVELVLTIEVPAVPPKVTLVVPPKFVPVIVTIVEPVAGPETGETDEIVGIPANVYPFVSVAKPPAVVKITSTAPAVLGGVTTVIEVELALTIEMPAVPPKVTPVVALRLEPVIVTVVPPAIGPDAGETLDINGAATYVNAPELVTLPPEPVTITLTTPDEPLAGVTTVIDVALELKIEVPAVPPNVTEVVPVKLVPEIVTVVPPATGPNTGDNEVIVGASTKVNPPLLVAVPPAPVITTSTAPAVLAGVTTVIEVALELTIVVPAVPPNVTEDVAVKLVPVIVTVVPPAVGPDANPVAAKTDEMVGVPT